MGTDRDSTTLDVLAVGAHPDDVELACGGTLAKLQALGHRFGIVHLTAGEMGTRGSVTERRQEAERAAHTLGASTLDILDCGDGDLRHGRPEQDALIALLRRYRPDVVLGPTPSDRHPDHVRAHTLVREACFYSGLTKREIAESGEPFRPAAVFSYMQHHPFAPSFVVDVTSTWEIKERALDAYASQLHRSTGPSARGPSTKVATPEFRLAVRGRAQHFGQMIGAAYGEPFWSPLPLAVANPLDLRPGGVR